MRGPRTLTRPRQPVDSGFPFPIRPPPSAAVTNASRTLLMDLDSLEWHDQTIAAFQCPRAALPRIVSNAEVYGLITPSHATAPQYGSSGGGFGAGGMGGGVPSIHPLGPLEGVPIAGCLGDQMAAMLGACRTVVPYHIGRAGLFPPECWVRYVPLCLRPNKGSQVSAARAS